MNSCETLRILKKHISTVFSVAILPTLSTKMYSHSSSSSSGGGGGGGVQSSSSAAVNADNAPDSDDDVDSDDDDDDDPDEDSAGIRAARRRSRGAKRANKAVAVAAVGGAGAARKKKLPAASAEGPALECVQEAVLVSAGKDGLITLWSVNTGRQLRSFRRHASAVTSVAALLLQPLAHVGLDGGGGGGNYTPNSGNVKKKNVLTIVSGSVDGYVISDALVSIEDEALRAFDSDEAKNRYPSMLLATVPEEFQAWPRLFRLSARENMTIDEFFAQDQFALFKRAISCGRSDFVETFLPLCPTGLLLSTYASKELISELLSNNNAYLLNTNPSSSKNQKKGTLNCLASKEAEDVNFNPTILSVATERGDIRAIRVVLDLWAEILEQQPLDFLDQCKGPFTRLNISELVKVCETYPLIFQNFIIRIKLLPAHPLVSRNCNSRLKPQKLYLKIGSMGELQQDLELWNKKFSNSLEPMTAQFIPLPFPADLRMLKAYVDASDKLDSVIIFESDCGLVATKYAWGKYGLKYHRLKTVAYFIFMVVYIIYLITPTKVQYTVIPLLFFNVGFLTLEVLQIVNENSSFLIHFSKFWPMIELASSITILLTLVLRISGYVEANSTRFFLSLASIMQFGKILYFLRAYETFGPLVEMIIQIASDIRFFVALLVIVMFGFSLSFWVLCTGNLDHPTYLTIPDIPYANTTDEYTTYQSALQALFDSQVINSGSSMLSNDDPQLSFSFGTLQGSFLTVLTFILGQYDIDGFQTCSLTYKNGQIHSSVQTFAIFMSALHQLIVAILMLNLLIGLMTESYSRLSSKGVALSRLMQAKLMCETGAIIKKEVNKNKGPKSYNPMLIHILKRTADLAIFNDGTDTADGGLSATQEIADEAVLEARTSADRLEASLAAQAIELDEAITAQQESLDEMHRLLEEMQQADS